MDYKKPQSTLVQGGVGIYPLTTADQVILADGSRLEKDGRISADSAANSAKLGGKSASEYALKTDTAPDSSKLGGKTLAEIMLALYPVGAVYISVNSTSPASLFGGTWEQLKDRFLLGAGDSYTAGSTGGEATHTLTVDEIPSHGHGIYAKMTWGDDRTLPPWTPYLTTGSITDAGSNGETAKFYPYGAIMNKGGGAAHNNMPPYLAVYMWKRVS